MAYLALCKIYNCLSVTISFCTELMGGTMTSCRLHEACGTQHTLLHEHTNTDTHIHTHTHRHTHSHTRILVGIVPSWTTSGGTCQMPQSVGMPSLDFQVRACIHVCMFVCALISGDAVAEMPGVRVCFYVNVCM